MPVCKMTNGQDECLLQGTVPPKTDIPDKMFSQGQHRTCELGAVKRGLAWRDGAPRPALLALTALGHSARLSESQQNSSPG